MSSQVIQVLGWLRTAKTPWDIAYACGAANIVASTAEFWEAAYLRNVKNRILDGYRA
jgi:hypothetical protein